MTGDDTRPLARSDGLGAVEAYAEQRGIKFAEAIRRLVDAGLKQEGQQR